MILKHLTAILSSLCQWNKPSTVVDGWQWKNRLCSDTAFYYVLISMIHFHSKRDHCNNISNKNLNLRRRVPLDIKITAPAEEIYYSWCFNSGLFIIVPFSTVIICIDEYKIAALFSSLWSHAARREYNLSVSHFLQIGGARRDMQNLVCLSERHDVKSLKGRNMLLL